MTKYLTLAAIVASGHLALAQNPGCSRECLRGLLDSYVAAMTRHDPAKLAVSPAVKFTENGKALKLGEGLWQTATAVPYRSYAFDTQSGAAALHAVVRENGVPASFTLRIKVAEGKIAEAETIVTRKGEAPFFAPEKQTSVNVLYAQMVPMAERTARKDLIATAEAYFAALETNGTANYKPAPFADDAERFENGMQTTNVPIMDMPAASAAEQLEKGFFKGVTLGRRRYPVVDVDHGLVLGITILRMAVPGTNARHSLLLAEVFKVTGGKIRQIQGTIVNYPNDLPTIWN